MYTPVGETEMREFFDRVASHFVSLSSQARELQELQVTVQEINAKLDQVTAENANLKRDITDTWDIARRLEQEKNEAQQANREAADRLSHLANEHNVLQSEHVNHRSDHEGLVEERNKLQQSYTEACDHSSELESELARVRQELDWTKQDRDRLQHLASERYEENARLRDAVSQHQGNCDRLESENRFQRETIETLTKERDEYKAKVEAVQAI